MRENGERSDKGLHAFMGSFMRVLWFYSREGVDIVATK